jgi:F-type H+-transporting ATPase subunit b
MLRDRRERIEQGLRDADAARRDRESAADQRQAVIAEARREASDILVRAQKLSDETREKGVADTQAEIERLRERALPTSTERSGARTSAARSPIWPCSRPARLWGRR